MSKRIWLVAASVAALSIGMASAAVAGSATPSIADGFVSLAVGASTLAGTSSGTTTTVNGLSIEGAASGSYNFTTTLGFQGDIVLGSQGYSQGPATVNDRNVEAAIHAFYRNDQYLVGAFGQYGNDAYSASGIGYGVNFDHFYGGAEGQLFLGNTTLYGQVGAQQYDVDVAGAGNIGGWFGTFEARYFLQPDFKIDAHVGANGIDGSSLGPSASLNTWTAGLGAEYRFSGTPFSIFGRYDYTNESATGLDGSVSDNRILVGAKFNFDTTTLFQRDRSGASLAPVQTNGLLPFTF